MQIQPYACRHGATLWRMDSADMSMWDAVKTQIRSAGFKTVTARSEEAVYFSTWVREQQILTASYFPREQSLQVILDTKSALPPCGDTKAVTTPLLTQVKHRYFAADCGMTYVIRLRDGRFVIIDGGYDEAGEAAHLFSLLTEQNVLDEKPHIAAWFITHPHSDHFGGLVGLCREFSDQFILDTLVYNWPLEQASTGFSDLQPFDWAVSTLKDTTIVIGRTGQRFTFGDTTLDILFACEDLYPLENLVNLNDCSLVIRATIAGRRVLFLGDAMPASSAVVCRRYPDESLRAEFLQVGHHGYGGGSDELYRRVHPETLLWPCPDFWFHAVRLWPCNHYLITAPSIQQTIVSGQREVTLDMTAPTPCIEMYPPCGVVVYAEDFSDTDPYRLGWSALTGGSTGNGSPLLELDTNQCTVTADNMRAVCEWVQPGVMQDVDKFTLTFSGTVDTVPERVGLIFNYATPTVWAEEAVCDLPLQTGAFTVTLTADSATGKATLVVNDETVREMPFDPAERHGIYFVLQNGCVTLHNIEIKR